MHAKSQILIVGAGPAGSSLAIRLSQQNFHVVLIEREKFPRHKLCGEFISPECLAHFKELGVLEEMIFAGGDRITETRFFEPYGKSVSVPSSWFGESSALSLSRAEMDYRLMNRAKEMGVEVLEETNVIGLLLQDEVICGVIIRDKRSEAAEIKANLIIDATGRASILSKLFEKKTNRPRTKDQKPKLVGFKTHLENVDLEKGRCEIYSFPGGYGGLSHVEAGFANLCFMIRANIVKELKGDAGKILKDIVCKNRRAAEALRDAKPVNDWLAVAIGGFGIRDLNPANNLYTVGDSAAFIDPFTGSGILMALESSEILAGCISDCRFKPERISNLYKTAYTKKFGKRLRVCSFLRRAAFVPNLAAFVISLLGISKKAREFLVRATRQNVPIRENKS